MRMLLILALVCAPMLYAQADPVRGPAPKPGQAEFKDGEDAFNEGRMQEAVDAFTKSLDAAPKNHEALAYRAAAYVALGKLESAEEDVDAAIKLESDFSLTWNTRGYIRWLQKNFPGAIEDFTSAIAYGTDDRRIDDGGRAQMHQNRGIAWQDAGNTDRALLDFNRCIELQPDNPAFFENRGLIFVDKRMFDVAFKDFDRALELDSKNARAYVNRAWAARLMGDYEQSVRDYSQALRLQKDYGQALIGRAYAWLGWGRPEVATKDFEAAKLIDGFKVQSLTGLGEIALEEGRSEDALELFHAANWEPNFQHAATRGEIRAYLQLGKPESAKFLVLTLCGYQRSAENFLLYAEVYFRLNDYQRVIGASSQALELNPELTRALVLRSRAYVAKSDFDAALFSAESLELHDYKISMVEQARIHAKRLSVEGDKIKYIYLELLSQCLLSAQNEGVDVSLLSEDPDFAAAKNYIKRTIAKKE